MKASTRFLSVAALALGAAYTPAFAQTTVFSSDFNTAIPSGLSAGSATVAGVQGYAGLGVPGNVFGGSFLRSATGNVVTLTLSGLPQHNAIGVDFLFAAIDSLDGTGAFPAGDFFKITLDGTTLFRESFANALPSQIQSYVPPTGVEIARRVDLGFSVSSNHLDSAYDLGADPTFQNIAHSGSTAIFTFQIEGPGNQALTDESWAMDNLQVTVSAVPEPQSYALLLAGLGAVGFVACRRRPRVTEGSD